MRTLKINTNVTLCIQSKLLVSHNDLRIIIIVINVTLHFLQIAQWQGTPLPHWFQSKKLGQSCCKAVDSHQGRGDCGLQRPL